MPEQLTVKTIVNSPMEKVWSYYTNPEHITKWNFASDDWHCPRAKNDLRAGGQFSYRMESKESGDGFEFSGTYDEVDEDSFKYTMDDGRKVSVEMSGNESTTEVIVMFEAEGENDLEFQKQGWQAILNNFKSYVESN